MAEPQGPPEALLMTAVFSRHRSALDWGRQRIDASFGPVELESQVFEHTETQYYAEQMGEALVKQFLVVGRLFDPADLASVKLRTNAWEHELASSGQYAERRPLNIDPGYITLSKLVLASAKDRAHRIYLRDGIYAEECLYYVGGWQSRPWTYPDYQRPEFQEFFTQARDLLKQLMRGRT